MQHVVPAVIDLIVKDNAVGVTIAALASRSEVAHRCNVSQGQVASQSVRESTDVTVATAVVIKSGVPSQSPAKVGCCGISGRVRHKCTGVSERLGVVHPESMAVEEVIRSGNHFVSDQGKEVTQLNIPVAVGEFAVRLRQGKPISGSASQAGIQVAASRRVSERLCISCIDTVHAVEAESPVPATATVCQFFGVDPALVNVDSVWVAVD